MIGAEREHVNRFLTYLSIIYSAVCTIKAISQVILRAFRCLEPEPFTGYLKKNVLITVFHTDILLKYLLAVLKLNCKVFYKKSISLFQNTCTIGIELH